MNVKSLLANKPTGVITVTPNQSFCEASKLLSDNNIGAVVVVGDDGQPVGILSERDIVRQVAARGEDAVALKVQDFMTTDLIIALPEDELSYVMSTMTDKRIRHLPVMDDQKLIGIVSIGDVVKAQRDHFRVEARMLQSYIDGSRA